jgi:predicted Zn finger-like uncharacterized protein
MALIRCPSCDTMHDLDDAFLASGRRKVRCASCRTVFETSESESDSTVTIALPLPEPQAPRNAAAMVDVDAGLATAAAPEEVFEPEIPEPAPSGEAMAEAPALSSAMDAEISADDLEALFADEAPAAPAADIKTADEQAESSAETAIGNDVDPAALAMEQDAAAAALAATEDPAERRSRRAGNHAKPTRAAAAAPPPRGGMIAAMVMAASIGTVATLVMLRQETVRLFPATSKMFDAVGLSASARGLDIVDVQSQMVIEDGRETLEVTGRVTNNAKTPQKLPVLRLSIRGGTGNELYVWTASADVQELAPGETTRFTRRLASPPPESHSVMVRFVAKDDIVAAIR